MRTTEGEKQYETMAKTENNTKIYSSTNVRENVYYVARGKNNFR